jgi:hypothetical protein
MARGNDTLMAVIPLALKAYARADAFVPEVVCLNMLLEKDESGLSPDNTLRIQRPGLVTTTTLPAPLRGLSHISKNGHRLAVSGDQLYDNGANVGGVYGQGLTPMVSTAFVTAIVGGDRAFLYNTTVSLLAMPDNRPVNDVEQLNGYILLSCPDGRFYWLEPGQTVVDGLNFATAESSADGLVAIVRVAEDILMLGAESGEWWQATGDADAPFQRVSGRGYERGCLSRDSVQRFDNSVVWVGDDCNVYRGGAVPELISDSGISERIRKRTGSPSAWVFGPDGHKLYVLRIPGQGTFTYDASTRSWAQFSSPGMDLWLPHVGYELDGIAIAGSSIDGRIWTVTPTAIDDDGVAFPRTVSATVPVLGKPPRNDSLTLGVGCSADCSVWLRWKDGQDDFPAYPEELEVRAPLDLATVWRLGMPDQPYRTFEFTVNDPVRVQFNGAVVNAAWA